MLHSDNAFEIVNIYANVRCRIGMSSFILLQINGLCYMIGMQSVRERCGAGLHGEDLFRSDASPEANHGMPGANV